MEASGALSMEWKCRVLSRGGLRSPGRKVNSEGLCAPRDQPEKEERERENDMGRPSLGGTGSAALFSKRAFIPWVIHSQKWNMQGHTESAQHSISLTIIKTSLPFAYLSTSRVFCCVHYLLALWPANILWLFPDKGWSTRKLVFSFKVFFSIFSNLHHPHKVLNKVTFHRAKV